MRLRKVGLVAVVGTEFSLCHRAFASRLRLKPRLERENRGLTRATRTLLVWTIGIVTAAGAHCAADPLFHSEAEYKQAFQINPNVRDLAIIEQWGLKDPDEWPSRGDLCQEIRTGRLKEAPGFGESFCQNAVEDTIEVQAGMRWSSRASGGWTDLTELFPVGTQLKVFKYGGAFISMVCGNWSPLDAFQHPTLLCNAVPCACGDGTLAAYLQNAQGKGISALTVQFFVDGNLWGVAPTDDSGNATFALPLLSLSSGEHIYYASFAGDSDYTAARSGACTITAPRKTQITCDMLSDVECGQPATLGAVLHDENQTPVTGERLRFIVEGEELLSERTDSTGWTSVEWEPDSTGQKSVLVQYDGGDCICPNETSCTFRVYATVTARKFDDSNINGRKDADEDDVGSWPMTLFQKNPDGSLTQLASGVTDSTGRIKFPNQLDAGSYVVAETGSGIVWEPKNEQSCVDVGFCYTKATWSGQRWQFTGATLDGGSVSSEACAVQAPAVAFDLACTADVSFGNVRLGTLTVRKWDDTNMNGVPDGTEAYLDGWPIQISGPLPSIPCSPTWPQQKDTEAKFVDLLPGSYTVRENLGWVEVQPCATDPYRVQRADHLGKRWQATTPVEFTLALPEGGDIQHEFGNVCLGSVTACKYWDKNMSGSWEPAAEDYTDTNSNGQWDPAELFDDINNNGVWNPAEPFEDVNLNGFYDPGEAFTDLNGSGCWDRAEPLRDDDGNGVWDGAEPWDDTFANGVWDDEEPQLPDIPLTLCGTAADGRCIGPFTLASGEDGAVEIAAIPIIGEGCSTFEDLPPGRYRIFEDVEWCDGPIDWCSNGAAPPPERRKMTYNGARWFATTDIMREFDYPECADLPSLDFGNQCFGSISGILTRKDCPNDEPAPLEGWEVCLRTAAVEQTQTFTDLPFEPTNPDCVPVGYCQTTGSDGSFRFGELVPGLYMVRETPQEGFAAVGSDVDLCVPFRIKCDDVFKPLQVRSLDAVCPVYQAVEGFSEGQIPCMGYVALDIDPITAVPGILTFGPGSNWENFVRAPRDCVSYCIKDVILEKTHPVLRQCTDVFPAGRILQHGNGNIRRWWPLMYEPAGTEWTLTILYSTFTPVELSGETSPSVVHQDRWAWRVDVSLESLDRLIDLFHELPFGKDEVPLISSETDLALLKTTVGQAMSATNPAEASAALAEMELLVSDMCIYASPSLPFPAGDGRGLGIANTVENPACCKILSDLDYLLGDTGNP